MRSWAFPTRWRRKAHRPAIDRRAAKARLRASIVAAKDAANIAVAAIVVAADAAMAAEAAVTAVDVAAAVVAEEEAGVAVADTAIGGSRGAGVWPALHYS